MLNIFKKLKNNFILASLFFGFTACGQVLFYSLHDTLTLQIPGDKFIALFIIIFIFSFIRQHFWRFLSMSFIYLLSFYQMVHLEYFGLPVHATEIYLLFTQTGEILGTLREDFFVFFRPFLIVIPGAVFLWWVNKKLIPHVGTRFLYLLFIFYFIYNPSRTFVTGNKWGRQPSTEEFDGMNIYLSFSYFLGKILPHKLSSKAYKEFAKNKIELTPGPKQIRNIIVVQGESLSPNHMSLYDYRRVTTPYLESIKNDKNFIYRYGISSGVSTDIAVAFFMNTTYGLNGNRSVFNAKHCLFKLAKEQKFETYFYSTQSQQQLRYITNSICPRDIQNYKNLANIQPNLDDENKADDHKLVDELKKIGLNDGNKFILLHQRGSHSPYSMRYNELSDQFTDEEVDSARGMQVNFYDNSVYHFDLFMQKLIDHVNTLEVPTIIFVISDHGEALGEEGVWGHGMLKKSSFEIPILIYGHKEEKLINKIKNLDVTPTHLNISLLIAESLGYKANVNSLKTPDNYIVLGNDMDGFAGYLDLDFQEGKLINVQRKDI